MRRINIFELAGKITLDDSSFLKGIGSAETAFNSLSETVGGVLNGIFNASASEGQRFVPVFAEGVLAGLQGAYAAGESVVLGVVNGLAGGIQAVVETASRIGGAFIAGVSSFASEAAESGRWIFDSFYTGLSEKARDVFATGERFVSLLASGVDSVIKNAVMAGQNVFDRFVSGIAVNFSRFYSLANDMITTLVNGVMGAVYMMDSGSVAVVNRVWDYITGTNWLTLGAGIVSGIADGIVSAVGSVINAIRNMCQQAMDTVAGFFGAGALNAAGEVNGPLAYSGGGSGMSNYASGLSAVNITQNIQTVPMSPSELALATKSSFEIARWA